MKSNFWIESDNYMIALVFWIIVYLITPKAQLLSHWLLDNEPAAKQGDTDQDKSG
jgi:hypothetical protein